MSQSLTPTQSHCLAVHMIDRAGISEAPRRNRGTLAGILSAAAILAVAAFAGMIVALWMLQSGAR